MRSESLSKPTTPSSKQSNNSSVKTLLLLLVVSLSAAFNGCAHLASGKTEFADKTEEGPLSAWVELGPEALMIARAIVRDSASCPRLAVDSQTLEMGLRAERSKDSSFPVQVCELVLPLNVHQVTLNGLSLPLPPQKLERVVVIGDTGCRIKKGFRSSEVLAQACNDPEKWPFAQVAERAAALKPDLVIHVGDYHYREAPCPDGQSGCAGSVAGDVWESWDQDFFKPAQSLLQAAPWIFVRGNHESCERAGQGFARFLSTEKMQKSCPKQEKPHFMNWGGQNFITLDSAPGVITHSQLSELNTHPVKNAWLLTHQPLWYFSDQEKQSLRENVGSVAGVSLVLAGHRHLFAAMSFKDGRAPELISGNGGTMLETSPPRVQGASIDGTSLAQFAGVLDFGFILLEKKGESSWNLQAFDSHARKRKSCKLFPQLGADTLRLSCENPGF